MLRVFEAQRGRSPSARCVMKKAGEKSKASMVRDALRSGPKTREQVHEAVPGVSRSAINSALLDMCNVGAVESDEGLFRLHRSISSEADYRRYMLAVRRSRAAVAKPVKPDLSVALQVNEAIRGWPA